MTKFNVGDRVKIIGPQDSDHVGETATVSHTRVSPHWPYRLRPQGGLYKASELELVGVASGGVWVSHDENGRRGDELIRLERELKMAENALGDQARHIDLLRVDHDEVDRLRKGNANLSETIERHLLTIDKQAKQLKGFDTDRRTERERADKLLRDWDVKANQLADQKTKELRERFERLLAGKDVRIERLNTGLDSVSNARDGLRRDLDYEREQTRALSGRVKTVSSERERWRKEALASRARSFRTGEDFSNAEFLLRTNAAVVWPVLEEYIKILREQPTQRGSQEDAAADLEARMRHPENYPPNAYPADGGKRYRRGDVTEYRKFDGAWQGKGFGGWFRAFCQDDTEYVEVKP